jgi:hypothetical protein
MADIKQGSDEVESKGKPCGIAIYPIYVTVAEAAADQGEEKLLKVINTQVKTRAMNLVRAAANPAQSKKALEMEAFNRISAAEANECLGDFVKYQALLTKKIDEIRAEKAAATEAAASPDEDE